MSDTTIDYGNATLGPLTVRLTQQAYAENYGTGVRYYAHAIDVDGNPYHVAWDTTPEWDDAQQIYRDGGYQDLPSLLDDESNACNWDVPVEIIALS